MATLTPQRRVLATAAAEIGYSRWKDSKQGTKYARETQPVFWPRDTWLLANGISFCDIFVTWVFWKALGKDFVTGGGLPAGASYNTDYRASKGGRVGKPPKPGDVLVFDWNWATAATNHVGILEKVLPSGNYQTIEGNTSTGSSGSQSNGGRVARRTRRPGQVRYVIRPNWAKAGGTATKPSTGASSSLATGSPGKPWTTSPRVNAFTKAEITSIQQILAGFDLDLGKWGVDGKYGDTTGEAVKTLQRELEVSPTDGIYGPGTEKAVVTIRSDISSMKKTVDKLEDRVRAIIAYEVPRVTFLSGLVDDDGNSIRENLAASLRRVNKHTSWNNIKSDRTEAKVDALLDAVKQLPDIDLDVDAIKQAAYDGAATGAAEIEAQDVAELLTVGVRDDAGDDPQG